MQIYKVLAPDIRSCKYHKHLTGQEKPKQNLQYPKGVDIGNIDKLPTKNATLSQQKLKQLNRKAYL